MQPTEYKVTDNHDGTLTIKSQNMFGETTWKLTVARDGLCVHGFYTSTRTNEVISENVLVYPVDHSTVTISLY